VLRGGFGIYYGSTFGDQFLSFPKNPPFVLTERLEAPAGSIPTLTLNNPFPAAGSAPRNPSFVAFDPHIKMNYVQQYNLTLERQITNSLGLRVTYLGQNFKHTWRAYDANQPREFGPGPIQDRRPLQPFSNILYYDSGGAQSSHSLQVGVMKRYSSGLLLQAEYQYVRAIGDDLYTGPQDIRNFRADRANLSGIRRQVLTLNYLYDLPFGKGKPFLNHGGISNVVLGGWQVGGITTRGTGTPFSPAFTATVQGAPSGRPNVVGDWHVADPSITQWFNPAAFATPAPFTFGNSGKNVMIGPGLITVDLSYIQELQNQRARYRAVPLGVLQLAQSCQLLQSSGEHFGAVAGGTHYVDIDGKSRDSVWITSDVLGHFLDLRRPPIEMKWGGQFCPQARFPARPNAA
jgi:hypothetical protein